MDKANPAGDFHREVLRRKLGTSTPVVPKLHEISFPALCRWLERSRRVAAFHEEKTNNAGCMVGLVSHVSPTAVSVRTFSFTGELDDAGDEWEIPFEDLTRIDCLGEYERSFEIIGE